MTYLSRTLLFDFKIDFKKNGNEYTPFSLVAL